jgi:hypothetical protein
MIGTNLKMTSRIFPALLAVAALGCGTNQAVIHYDDVGGGGAGGGNTSSATGPACAGQCLPLGPAEWSWPTLLWIGTPGQDPECPTDAPVKGAEVFADLNAPTLCGTCQCDAPSGTCTLPTTLTASSAPCPGDGAGVTHTSFDAPAGWSGACSAAAAIPANQKCNGVNCVQSLTIAPLVLAETPCAVSTIPVAAALPYTWGAVAHSCHGIANGPCPSADEVCRPAIVPGFAQCIFQKGDNECPAAYSDKHVFYKGIADTRSCTACGCGAPTGGTCTAFLSAYKDGACSSPVGSVTVDATGSACLDILPSGQALGSKLSEQPVYAPGVCQVSGGAPMGEAIPDEPSTYCCLPQ